MLTIELSFFRAKVKQEFKVNNSTISPVFLHQFLLSCRFSMHGLFNFDFIYSLNKLIVLKAQTSVQCATTLNFTPYVGGDLSANSFCGLKIV